MTKKKEKKKEEVKENPVYFENVLDSILNLVRQKVGEVRVRPGGAQEYGAVGMFICANEALSEARTTNNYHSLIAASAYSIAASMQMINQWNIELLPKPKEIKKEK